VVASGIAAFSFQFGRTSTRRPPNLLHFIGQGKRLDFVDVVISANDRIMAAALRQ
jgi:hypothetical protein